VAASVALPTVTFLAYAYLVGNFLPQESVAAMAFFSALTLATAALLSLTWLKRNGIWQPSNHWASVRSSHKALAVFLGPLIFVFVIWGNMAHAIPYVITMIAGTPSSVTAVGKKSRHSGRYSLCRQEIDIQPWWRTLGFRWCVSDQEYLQLPDGLFEVEVYGEATWFGLAAEGVRVTPQRGR